MFILLPQLAMKSVPKRLTPSRLFAIIRLNPLQFVVADVVARKGIANMAGKLTALKVKNLWTPGRHTDGTAGLHLHIQERRNEVTRSWVQRITVDGKRRDLGLGTYPDVSLARARGMALDNAERIRKGKEPHTARQTTGKAQADPKPKPEKPSKPTFAALAEKHYALQESEWSGDYCRVFRSVLKNHLLPALGNQPIDTITLEQIRGIMEPLRISKPSLAQKVRAAGAGVFNYAIDSISDMPDFNPFGDRLDRLMKGAGRVKEHHVSLPYNRVADTLAIVDASDCWDVVKLALRFLVLTAARTAEVRNAEWTEIDWENRLWVVPAHKMKKRREHRQPLSRDAMDVLRAAWELSDDHTGLVFPSYLGSNKPLVANIFNIRFQLLEIRATGHGFRSSFRTWCQEETNVLGEVAEQCLAHAYGNSIERTYARGDMLDRRRELLEGWAAYLRETLTVN